MNRLADKFQNLYNLRDEIVKYFNMESSSRTKNELHSADEYKEKRRKLNNDYKTKYKSLYDSLKSSPSLCKIEENFPDFSYRYIKEEFMIINNENSIVEISTRRKIYKNLLG